MTGLKTNERPGTRAVLKHSGVSAYKAREVLDLIRGKDVQRASEILEYCEREVATVIGKVLHSASANAFHNEGIEPEELYVSACFADEGTTLKRWRPRARGRATRIRKRTCHVTVIVSRMPEDELNRRRARQAADAADRRARRVAGARRQGRAAARTQSAETEVQEPVDEQVLEIVAAGDSEEGTDIDAAVEQALAADEDSGDGDDLEGGDDELGDAASQPEDEEDADGDDASGDEESD
ncbi:MAG: 50S ribosomal protein L22 [Acidimicrobiales bacterium]|jgi:large subunit ribosomal protein L22